MKVKEERNSTTTTTTESNSSGTDNGSNNSNSNNNKNSTSKTTNDTVEPTPKKIVLLKDAPPPWHSIVFVGILSSICMYSLPTIMESMDDIATMETFTHVLFPNSCLSLSMVVTIRGCFALSVWIQMIHTIFLCDGWEQTTHYLSTSQLKRTPYRFRGWKTQCPFTSWCWCLLGIHFTLSSYIAYQGLQRASASSEEEVDSVVVPTWMLRLAFVSWEIAAPLAPLVSTVIRYGIWPIILKGNGSTTNLKHWRNMLAHNCNSIYVIVEIALLGGLPIRLADASLAPLFGVVYILFTWSMTKQWTDSNKHGPQFIYFFMDTTLPGYQSTIALIVLVTILAIFFILWVITSSYLQHWMEGNMIGHLLFTIVLSSVLVRIRD